MYSPAYNEGYETQEVPSESSPHFSQLNQNQFAASNPNHNQFFASNPNLTEVPRESSPHFTQLNQNQFAASNPNHNQFAASNPSLITMHKDPRTNHTTNDLLVSFPMDKYKFGSKPEHVQCTSCGRSITTRLEHETGLMTWVVCLFGIVWIWFVLIFLCKLTKDVVHYCPECSHRLGKYERSPNKKILIFIGVMLGILFCAYLIVWVLWIVLLVAANNATTCNDC